MDNPNEPIFKVPPTVLIEHPHKSWFVRHIVAEVFSLALVIGAGAVGYYWQISKIPTPVFEPVKHEDERTNWKTYKNEEYGFEFEYPPIWMLENNLNGVTLVMYGPGEHKPGDAIFQDAARVIFLGFNKLTEDIKNNTTEWKEPKSVFSRNGFSGVVVFDIHKPEEDWGSWIKAYSLANSGRGVQLDWLSSNKFESTDFTDEKYLFPILSTFKFSDDQVFCIQVITPAKNILTGEVKDFSTPCDVPEGWEKLSQ